MMMTPAPRLQRLMTTLVSRWLPTSVFYVSDRAGWSFDWDIHYLQQHLKRHAIPTRQLQAPDGLRGHILHFWDRYYFLSRDFSPLAPHNRILLTWFHGSRADPALRPLFEQLQTRLPSIEKIITANQTSRQQLLAAGVPDAKINVIPLGVDTTQFKPPTPQQRAAMRAKLGVPDGAFCVGSFQKDGSGWAEGTDPKLIKGPDIFLEVIARVQQQQSNLFVVLTGPARGYVKNGLERLGVPYCHHFVADYRQLCSYYHALDAYLITSRDEGGPKGLVESWATGVPVISTNMGMPADWVEHGTNGLLAAIEDVETLALSLHRLRVDVHLPVRLMQNGLKTVQALDWATIVDRYYVPLYREMLTSNR